MARQLRIQYEGAVYHITCRGNERRNIFIDDKDRDTFIELLRDSIETYNVIIYSYVLMNNHFHFLLETPNANLSEFMRQFNITFTSYFNRRYSRVGHLYQGRYKSLIIDKENYLAALSRYIHLNPIKIEGMRKLNNKERLSYLLKYKWSSLPGYLDEKYKSPFIDYLPVLELYGGDTIKGRSAYYKDIENNLICEDSIKENVVGQNILGNDQFVKWLKENFSKDDLREVPTARKLSICKPKDEIIRVICEVTSKTFDEIKCEKGTTRQILMEFLYKYSGLNGPVIGDILGVDYSTVSQGRKRLKIKSSNDESLMFLIKKIKDKLSI